MRSILILVFAALLLSGCGQKSAGLQEGAAAPDTQLFENGMEYLEKGQYIKARLSFQTLINTYPDSEYTPASFLAIADSYYSEAGTENLLQAEAQYKDFLIFYPTHEMADDAQLKIAAINYRLMRPYDRDPTNARKAETEFKRFLQNYPDSELSPTATEALREVEESLARHDHTIGSFYYKRNSYTAAEMRFKNVLDKYPNFSMMDDTLFKLGRSLEESGRVTEASVYYARIAAEYPFSEYFDTAKERLILLEKDVPVVDEQAAAIHASNRIEKNFSVWDPFKSVMQIFTGRPDIYEVARKRAEQRELAGEGLPSDSEGNP
ncbi:MAG: outer membrane protein assembly factor BamD [Acidobacteriota bacterium]|nr:MAG: outer membrane protein assembly factor BamD [Acidobacteriota bacterium]